MVEKDKGVSGALDFFLSHIPPKEWSQRKAIINRIVRKNISNLDRNFLSTSNTQLYTGADEFGWQLFLMESFLINGFGQCPKLNAKLGPFFEKLGDNLSDLKDIAGVEKRISRMISNQGISPASALFELTVALTWKLNGWHVEFLSESSVKTPDLKVEKEGVTYFIECKRLSEFSEFRERESKNWDRLFLPVKNLLYAKQASLILDIEFLRDIEFLDTNYLLDVLSPFIDNHRSSERIRIDKEIAFSLTNVNWPRINDHLKKQWVKYPSNQLELLVFGNAQPDQKLSSVFSGKLVSIGPEVGNNQFVDSIAFVCGAAWNVNTPYSVNAKARHIKRQLVDATRQVPFDDRSIIHLGIDTVDGAAVEELRHLKNHKIINKFNLDGKNIVALFIHHFQTYSPPDGPWFLDETVTTFTTSPLPIERYNVVAVWGKFEDGVHWKNPPPR